MVTGKLNNCFIIPGTAVSKEENNIERQNLCCIRQADCSFQWLTITRRLVSSTAAYPVTTRWLSVFQCLPFLGTMFSPEKFRRLTQSEMCQQKCVNLEGGKKTLKQQKHTQAKPSRNCKAIHTSHQGLSQLCTIEKEIQWFILSESNPSQSNLSRKMFNSTLFQIKRRYLS